MQRHGGAGLIAELATPHTRSVHHGVGADVAPLCAHTDCTSVLDDDLLHLDVLDDAHALGTRALRQCLGGVDGVGDAVTGQVHTADEVVDVGERNEVLDVGRRDDVDGQTEHACHRGATLQLFETLVVRRHRYGTPLLEPGGLTGLLLECLEQVGGVLREACEVVRRTQLPDESGGMPGGSTRELFAFEHHHVGDTTQRQVIRHAATDDATTDDDHPRRAG